MSLHILLIQDDPAVARIVIGALIESSDAIFRIEWVRSCSESLERLDGVAAILIDLCLPDSDGIETFDSMLRAAPTIPILILTSAQNEEAAKLAVQRGAQDYLFTTRLDASLLRRTVGSMIERAAHAEALFDERERAQVTLDSIGDAVVSTDLSGRVNYLNVVAEELTGWPLRDAKGRPVESVFQIIDATTRLPRRNPMTQALRDNRPAALAPNCLLVRRNGTVVAIENSAAPIHDRRGTVTGAVMVFHDVSVARALTLKMSHLAQYDRLTDLPNRVLLNERLDEAMTLSRRHHRKLAILSLDLDYFKHINESFGHVVGDLLLQSVARRLSACVRSSDTIGRQGNDEFVIALWEVRHAQDVAVTATRILEALRKPHHIYGHELHLTGSIGVVAFPDDGEELEALLKKADSAMYQAKESGRDRFQFFKAATGEKAIERQSLEASLRQGIERGEFVLHYQSRLDLVNGEVIGAEALLRWRHPQLGLIAPGQFIAIAMDCGLIVPIGRWVLREACRQMRSWQLAGMSPLSVAVNISAAELRAPDFVSGVRELLGQTGLEARYLELELTETALLEDPRSVSDTLEALKDIGVLLALDDVGSGHSSLTQLPCLPIDTLKIHHSLVRHLATRVDDASMVTAMISLGMNLHMKVVAEGVETRQQLESLQQHGCFQAQGYYFNPPVPAEEFGRLLRRKVSATASA
jgi:diguanylate cyclase (GGDEF)-like protein/PAS domain S-box-containing protein